MKNKMFATTAIISAVFSLSIFAFAQSNGAANGSNAKRSIPRPTITNLSCQTETKEFGQSIFLTNTTSQVLKKGTNVRYMIGTTQSQFNLANDLAPNATVKQSSLSYEGHPACKAWMYQ